MPVSLFLVFAVAALLFFPQSATRVVAWAVTAIHDGADSSPPLPRLSAGAAPGLASGRALPRAVPWTASRAALTEPQAAAAPVAAPADRQRPPQAVAEGGVKGSGAERSGEKGPIAVTEARPAAGARSETRTDATAAEAPLPFASPSVGSDPVPPLQSFIIQLASFRSEAQARTEWQRVQQRYPDLLTSLTLRVQRAVGVRGTYFRVIAVASGASDVHRLCRTMRDQGLNCLVMRVTAQDP